MGKHAKRMGLTLHEEQLYSFNLRRITAFLDSFGDIERVKNVGIKQKFINFY